MGENDDEVIERAIADGNDVLFTTTPKLMECSLRAAIRHPEVKILNCSLNMDHPSVRTYYGRIYEAKFLVGAIAGALADNTVWDTLRIIPFTGWSRASMHSRWAQGWPIRVPRFI